MDWRGDGLIGNDTFCDFHILPGIRSVSFSDYFNIVFMVIAVDSFVVKDTL